MEARKRVSANLKYWRTKRGCSRPHLSRKAGVSVNQIEKIENNQVNATLDTVEKLAHGVGVDVVEFLKRREN